MKEVLEKMVEQFQPALKSILDKGYYETQVEIDGSKATMHILTKGEVAEVSLSAGQSDIITREHRKELETMAHAVSEVVGVKFKDVKEAYDFFYCMSTDLFTKWYDTYRDLPAKKEAEVKKVRTELKNSQGAKKDAVSGS